MADRTAAPTSGLHQKTVQASDYRQLQRGDNNRKLDLNHGFMKYIVKNQLERRDCNTIERKEEITRTVKRGWFLLKQP